MIHCKNIFKSYGTIQALKGLSLSIPRGAVGLLGPNGAGKSTLLKVMMAMLEVDSGEVKVLGKKVTPGQREFLTRVGYMPEELALIPDHTAVTYLTFLGELSGMTRKKSLSRAHDTLHYVGIQQERYRPLSNLSLGQKQRVLLAQALVHHPEVVLLDEPTTGLDPEGRREFLTLIGQLVHKYNKGIVFSSHILQDIEEVCDYIVLLNKGTLVYQGSLKDMVPPSKGRYAIKVEGPLEPWMAVMEKNKISILKKGEDRLEIQMPPELSPNFLLEQSRNIPGILREITPLKIPLEELFMKKIIDSQS